MSEIDRIEMLNGMKDLAAMVRHYYESLRAEQFSAKEALALTLGYQASMFANSKTGDA